MIRRASRIAGTGLGIPLKVLTNNDLSKFVETSDEWIRTRTGISERRAIDREGGQNFTSLAKEAAEKALKRAGLKTDQIDFIIVSTTTPDTRMPNESSRLSGSLGCRTNVGCMDINTACCGFVTGMQMADAVVRAGVHQRVLLVGADMMISMLDWTDRTTCVLFGDGAAAVILEAVPQADEKKDSMVIDTMLYCESDFAENLVVPGGGGRSPVKKDGTCAESPFMRMNGKEVFKSGSRAMAEAAGKIIEKHGLKGSDISWFVPHQANVRILEKVAELAGIRPEQIYVNLDRWGNTSAATIPICLAEMEEKGLLKKGQLVLLDAFGGGYNYGASLIRW
jgi:3-oxoacyl-[acyl-carrier-protein] synthase III